MTFGLLTLLCRYAFCRQAGEQYWASDRVGMNPRVQVAHMISLLAITLYTPHLYGVGVTAILHDVGDLPGPIRLSLRDLDTISLRWCREGEDAL